MMRIIIISIIILLTMIFFGVQKDKKDDKVKENDEIISEKIVDHGYLYQNGKTIEYTKKIVKIKMRNR